MLCLHAYAFMQLLSVLVTQRFVSCVFKLGLEVLQVEESMGGALRDLSTAAVTVVPSTGEATCMISSL